MDDYPNPATEAELRELLDDVVLQAHRNGVEVPGSYVLRHEEPDVPDLEIQVHRLDSS